jgi:predicted kinase
LDDTRLEVILMCGLPGTGKDYWIAHNHPDLPVVSLDKLRIEMGISPTDEQGAIVNAGRDLAKGYLQSETPFIWNATNIVKPIRSGLIRLFAGYGARIRIVYLEVPIDRVFDRLRSITTESVSELSSAQFKDIFNGKIILIGECDTLINKPLTAVGIVSLKEHRIDLNSNLHPNLKNLSGFSCGVISQYLQSGR